MSRPNDLAHLPGLATNRHTAREIERGPGQEQRPIRRYVLARFQVVQPGRSGCA